MGRLGFDEGLPKNPIVPVAGELLFRQQQGM